VQLFTGLEADSFAGGNADLGAGAGVAADAGFAGFDGEDAESAKLDAVAFAEGFLHGFKDGVDGGLCLDTGEPGSFYDTLDEVLFDQSGSPSFFPKLRARFGLCDLRPYFRW